MLDLIIDYNKAKLIVKEQGFEGWLSYLNTLFPNRDFYTVSTFWYEDSKYICKAKGQFGDLIVGWS